MLSRLSFRAKLLLVLFVPFLALVVVAAAGLSDRYSAVHAEQQYGTVAPALRSVSDLSRAVEREGVATSWYAASHGASATILGAARNSTDAALRLYRADRPQLGAAGLGGDTVAAMSTLDRAVGDLAVERTKVDALVTDVASARSWYLALDDDAIGLWSAVGRDLAAGDTASSVTRIAALQRAEHQAATEATYALPVAATGIPSGYGDWVSAIAAGRQAVDQFTSSATPGELRAFRGAAGTPSADPLPASFPTAGAASLYSDYVTGATRLDHGIAAAADVTRATSAAGAATAQSDTRLYGGAAVFAMLLTLGLLWFVSRTVVAPVRRLTAAAREMSQHQLPALVEQLRSGADIADIEPTRIEVTSEDEIGELAQAFNDVEAVTLEVAHEQSRLLRRGIADLFVNLARRNQSLLERQLLLLDELERNESDPAALDALFKLDHMATRMRRNAESLLVLSGAEQSRAWQESATLLDVVRAAAGEIADFPRVELVGIDDQVVVSGRAVADVTHLIAELLENATSFSPPETAVVVSGAPTSTGFVLAVTDQGIGMPAERVASANALLARPPLASLALSRALGLHVVGSLAKRHGIAVELRPGAPTGLVALVALPHAVLEPPGTAVPHEPVYQPDVAEDGGPEPLGARREAWRPPDEPPVEEWRRGFEEPVAATPDTDGGDDRPEPDPDAPLPSRVPGMHLTHQPATGADAGSEHDGPLPQRVRDMLSRHAEGKERGRGHGAAGPATTPFGEDRP